MPDKKNPFHFSRRDIHKGEVDNHIDHISREFENGFALLRKYPKSVTIFGSSSEPIGSKSYVEAETLAARIVKDLDYAVITGGGPGIMEAANKGAAEAGGRSIGLHISLPHEHVINVYANETLKFSYFFARKTILTFAAEAFVFFPGGYGTLDELFSILTLVQTQKIPPVPIILFGSDYWNGFLEFLRVHTLEGYHAIDEKDLGIFEITDSIDSAVEIIKEAPVSEWWRNIN